MDNVQDFNRVVLQAIYDDMRKALVQQLAGILLPSRSAHARKLFQQPYALPKLYDGGARLMWFMFS